MRYQLLRGKHSKENSDGTRTRYVKGDYIELTPTEAQSDTFAGRLKLSPEPESKHPFDISEVNIEDGVNYILELTDIEEVSSIRDQEESKKGRKTILKACDEKMEELAQVEE